MINLKDFPKSSGVYMFKANEEVIYIGSSKNLYIRMTQHKSCINKGSDHNFKQDFYQFLQANKFTVEFQLETNYRQLEQQLIEQYNPKFNFNDVFKNTNDIKQYKKEWRKNHKKQIKQYYEKRKEEISKQQKQYNNQTCFYNGETLTLSALRMRLKRKGVINPTVEAKKYLI